MRLRAERTGRVGSAPVGLGWVRLGKVSVGRKMVDRTVSPGGASERDIGPQGWMTQLFDDSGAVVPVTVIEAGPCYVTQVKAEDSDGYNAVQVGFEEVAERKLTKGQLGHLQRANVPKLRFVRELRLPSETEHTLGDVIKADVFAEARWWMSPARRRVRALRRGEAAWIPRRAEDAWAVGPTSGAGLTGARALHRGTRFRVRRARTDGQRTRYCTESEGRSC